MSVMGIDIGTSGLKVLVISDDGNQISRQSKGYSLLTRQDGFFELDSEEVWQTIQECIRRANADAHAAGDAVTALSCSTQGEAVIPLDRHHRPLCLSPVSSDLRGYPHALEVDRRFGNHKIFTITGQMIDPIHSIYKILWWKHAQPEVFEDAALFVCFDAFLLLKLGMEAVADFSIASRMGLFNISTKEWDSELLTYVGIRRDQLPTVLNSGSYAGTIPEKISEQLGFTKSVRCYCGAHDQACSAFGSGLIDQGVHYSIGTTECLALLSRSPLDDCTVGLPSYPGVCAGTYVTLIGSQSGSRVLSWAAETFMKRGEEERLYELVRAIPPQTKTNVSFVSHMAGSTLYQDPSSKASMAGVDFSTTRDEIIKALLEGITFEQAIGYKKLVERAPHFDVDEFRIVGGGSTIENWVQIKSDIFNKRMMTCKCHDTGAMGAVLIAALGSGLYASPREAMRVFVEMDKDHHPHQEMGSYYQRKLSFYDEQYMAMKTVCPLMGTNECE